MALTLLWVFCPHSCAKDTLARAAGCAWLLLERSEADHTAPWGRAGPRIPAAELPAALGLAAGWGQAGAAVLPREHHSLPPVALGAGGSWDQRQM